MEGAKKHPPPKREEGKRLSTQHSGGLVVVEESSSKRGTISHRWVNQLSTIFCESYKGGVVGESGKLQNKTTQNFHETLVI